MLQDIKPRSPPRKMLEAMFDDELVQSALKFSKKVNRTQHFYVLYVGWLIVYKCAVDTKDPSSREQLVTRIPLRVCDVVERLPLGQKGGSEHSFLLIINKPERYDGAARLQAKCWPSESYSCCWYSLSGEKCTKILFHPASEETRESWLDQLALACDSDESDDEYEMEEKARPDDVASSAKEFDAREIIAVDGQEDTEREV